MSEKAPETKTFQQRVDEFVAVANQQVSDSSVDDVNTSIQFSAARFNAFSVARSVESAEHLKIEREGAIKFFSERYTEMLEKNIDEYISHFDRYAKK